MFDRFTDHARKVMGLARQESLRFKHDYIGTEHMALGLIQEGSGVASDVLKNLDVDPKEIRKRVEKAVTPGATTITTGQLPFTPRGKKVLEFALEEATTFGHNYIGTEHLLLGLIREGSGIAAKVLADIGVDPEATRKEIHELVGDEHELTREARFAESSGGDRDDDESDDDSRKLSDSSVLRLELFGKIALLEVRMNLLEERLEARIKLLEERLGED